MFLEGSYDCDVQWITSSDVLEHMAWWVVQQSVQGYPITHHAADN
jgi:hypothetical protein